MQINQMIELLRISRENEVFCCLQIAQPIILGFCGYTPTPSQHSFVPPPCQAFSFKISILYNRSHI